MKYLDFSWVRSKAWKPSGISHCWCFICVFCFVIFIFFFNFTTTYTRMLWMRWRYLLLIMEKQMPWLPKDNRKWRNMNLVSLKLVAKLPLFWAGLTTCIKLEGKIKSTLKWMWSNSSSGNLSSKKCITAKIVSAYLKYLQVKTELNFWK